MSPRPWRDDERTKTKVQGNMDKNETTGAGAPAETTGKAKKTRKPPTRKSPMVLLRESVAKTTPDTGAVWIEVANVKSVKDGIAKAKAGGDGSYAVATLRRSFTVATVSQQVVK